MIVLFWDLHFPLDNELYWELGKIAAIFLTLCKKFER